MSDQQKKYWGVLKLVEVMRAAQREYYMASKNKMPKDLLRKKLAKALELEARLDVEMQRVWERFPEHKPHITIIENPRQSSIDEWLAR